MTNIHVKFADIEFLREWGGDAWALHGSQWTLKTTIDFLYRFEERLKNGDWYDMLVEFEKEEFGAYYFDGKKFELDDEGKEIGYIESGWYHELNDDGDVIEEYRVTI